MESLKHTLGLVGILFLLTFFVGGVAQAEELEGNFFRGKKGKILFSEIPYSKSQVYQVKLSKNFALDSICIMEKKSKRCPRYKVKYKLRAHKNRLEMRDIIVFETKSN